MEIIGKEHPTKEEYLLARILSIFGMRKLASDKVKKILDNNEIKYVPDSMNPA
jgi:hypothetical protein